MHHGPLERRMPNRGRYAIPSQYTLITVAVRCLSGKKADMNSSHSQFVLIPKGAIGAGGSGPQRGW